MMTLAIRLPSAPCITSTHPPLHRLLDSSWSLIMPIIISSLTRPPASMISFAFFPSSVPCETCSLNMSPVAKWQTWLLYFSRILGA